MRRHPALQDLSRDHFTVLGRIVEVRRVVEGDRFAKDGERVRRSFLELAHDILPGHFAEEEALLLPELGSPEGQEHARRLQQEHDGLRRGFQALRPESGMEAYWPVAQALEAHIRWEENHLFEDLQAWLPEHRLQGLGVRSRAFREGAGLPVGPGTR